jgi:hypothetical protein
MNDKYFVSEKFTMIQLLQQIGIGQETATKKVQYEWKKLVRN